MTSEKEKLDTLLRALLRERPEYGRVIIPDSIDDKRALLRALMNVRMPARLPQELLTLQDEELQEQKKEKGVAARRYEAPRGYCCWRG